MTRAIILALAILAALLVAAHRRNVREWQAWEDDTDWLAASIDPYTVSPIMQTSP